ncbi:hypothetical protein AAHH67_26270 [Niallia circulans]
MGILLDLLNLAVYIPFLKVDEEEVCRNVKHLKNINGSEITLMMKSVEG